MLVKEIAVEIKVVEVRKLQVFLEVEVEMEEVEVGRVVLKEVQEVVELRETVRILLVF